MSSFIRSQALVPSIKAQSHINYLHKTPALISTSRAYSKTSQQAADHKINAPTSTLPAPIDLPAPLHSSSGVPSKLKNLVSIGRAYVSFYKTGLKNVWHNYRASLPHRKTLGLSTYIPTSPHNSPVLDENHGLLHRGQYQLVHRSARDVRRMIPFSLVLLICGEFTPLIIPLFGTSITPGTCRVPRQLNKEREALSKSKWQALSSAVQLEAAKEGAVSTSTPALGSEEELAHLLRFADLGNARAADAAGVLRACAGLGLVKSIDRTAAPLFVALIYRRRLLGHLKYLRTDDLLIRAGGGVGALSGDEVRIALGERGAIDFAEFEKDEGELRQWLNKWLDARKE